ncbi:DNA mismatch repair protein MutS [Sediminibacter sp. Hel_I_10]|uniref:DNA mismatch repair protein MutS n=1 Tax=Sediminibacter sp. Hel_I_10 TaxID=1392490 RepID=UPI0004798C55|nr:DNA mismatch repair protein MutS [Sediminibacter sp. Hel_I_10]
MADFKKGDFVSVLDDDIKGHVTRVTGDQVLIETSDGFDMEFASKDLIKEQPLGHSIFEHTDLEAVLEEKEQHKKRTSNRTKPKERNLPAMEVDLHIHQITTSNRRMTNHEMLSLQLDTARHKLEFAIKNRIQKVVFIHGVGEGVLKMELDYLFGRYDDLKFYAADYQKYGLGATEVYIFQNTKGS